MGNLLKKRSQIIFINKPVHQKNLGDTSRYNLYKSVFRNRPKCQGQKPWSLRNRRVSSIRDVAREEVSLCTEKQGFWKNPISGSCQQLLHAFCTGQDASESGVGDGKTNSRRIRQRFAWRQSKKMAAAAGAGVCRYYRVHNGGRGWAIARACFFFFLFYYFLRGAPGKNRRVFIATAPGEPTTKRRFRKLIRILWTEERPFFSDRPATAFQ